MARAPKFKIDNKKKKVFADVENLSEKEIKIVSKYLAIGYELEYKPTKKIFTIANIDKYIKAKGISKEEFDRKALAKEKNEEGKEKGFVYALRVFRSKYEDDFREFIADSDK